MNLTPITHGSREHLLKMCSLTVLTIISLTPNLGAAQSATPVVAQSPTPADADADTETESSGVQKAAASTGPIVDNWHFKNDAGSANLTVNPDGTYLFSGDYRKKKAGHDLDIALGLKNSRGGVVLFQFAGDVANGAIWSKQGKSDILKDDFTTFAGPHDWYVQYQLPLSSEGRAKLYEEREKKKEEQEKKEEKLRKEEKEAKERHDEKVAAEKKAALEKEKKQEREKAEAAAKQSQQSSSGGSSVWGTVLGVLGGVFAALF